MNEQCGDNKMIKIGEHYLINKKNITYVKIYVNSADGYNYITTYHMDIYFTGEKCIEFKTYKKEEFEEWVEKLL